VVPIFKFFLFLYAVIFSATVIKYF
jgi:hypothetical protein